MKVTDNETRWAKIGHVSAQVFLGKDILMIGAGCHLIFLNLITGEELTYTANHKKVGDGISCYVGHRSQNVFAFAENRTNPTVFVKTYPNFEEVHQFKDGDERGYIAMAFSETSLLVTVGDLPDFVFTVWHWRKGERLAVKNGNVRCLDQLVRFNFSNPPSLAQLGLGTTRLNVWDVFICGKRTVLTNHVVQIPPKCKPFTSVTWTTEGGLFVLDTSGSVYSLLPDNSLEKIIDFTEQGNTPVTFTWFKGGVAVLGPTNTIRHYKKSGTWSIDWSIVGQEPLIRILARFDHLIATTVHEELLKVMHTEKTFKVVKKNESQFNDFCLIYPTGDYFMALCHKNCLNLYQVTTGELMSFLELKREQGTVLTENPKFPYAALGLKNGKLLLISAYNPEKLTKMTEFHLAKKPINNVYFNECGTVFVAANLNVGLFFIIEGIPGGHMQIVHAIDAQRQIADYMMILSEDCYRIFCIPVTSDKFIAGNTIVRYCVIKNKGTDIKEYTIGNGNTLYVRLYAISGINRDRTFYAIPISDRTIHELEIKKGVNVAKVVGKILTGHQMKDIRLKRNRRHALTWAFDGFIILRSADFKENIAIALPHNRMQCGVKKAYVTPYEKYVLSLGRDNVLVCTNLMEKEVNVKLKEDLQQILDSSTYKLIFGRNTVGYVPTGKYKDKCYLEVEEMKRKEEEEQLCRKERNEILKEFKSIREQLTHLLSQNIRGPENEKLDLEEFNLNKALYEERVAYNKKLCTATETYLKNLIEAQDRISNFIKESFWNTMLKQECVIKGMFSNFEVKNYPVLPSNEDAEKVLNWIQHQRKIERHMNELNNFYPWQPVSESKLKEMMSAPPRLPQKDEDMTKLSAVHADSSETENLITDPETKIAMAGTDISRFIESTESHYLQQELITYFQTHLQWIISKNDAQKLKAVFNDKFDSVQTRKFKEMDNVKKKNSRLREIVSELNYFSEEKFTMRIEDPELFQVETPEAIIQVKDEEVPITPYISPSEQARLDAQAAEEERLRLLLLADDFKERALMAMMNGVLEVRWEDELKKDVPLPKCMIEKVPEEYNEEDLRTIRDYEQQVEFLNSERQRYKKMLTAEYQKLSNSVLDHVSKFNLKLADLLDYKLLIDAAISHETLKITRMKFFQYKRVTLTKKETDCLKRIADNEKTVLHIEKLIASLQESLEECTAAIDETMAREKLLDRMYKKDFQDLPLMMQEQVAKLYKKRPKMVLRSVGTPTVLIDLGKCVVSRSPPPLPSLTQECLEYLKSLDNLDMYVATGIDEHTYALLVKNRRHRIEYELTLKAAQMKVAEAETTLAAFNRRLEQKKQMVIKSKAELNEIRAEILSTSKNRQIQIVLPRGLVEIPLTGSVDDFQDAVLICRQNVENINEIILKQGGKKIKEMQHAMSFRRKILSDEWTHKKMRMQIEDLSEKLIDITSVRMTKELQQFLRSKDRDNKSMPFETEVDLIKATYENVIHDRKETVKKMKKQIASLKKRDKVVEERITELNVTVCEMNLSKDQDLDDRTTRVHNGRLKILLKRSRMINQIQNNHHEILALQTELELLRLKTFPALNEYKLCH